jgi:hypothetical protein
MADVESDGRVEGVFDGIRGGRAVLDDDAWDEADEEGRSCGGSMVVGGTRGAVVCIARAASRGANTRHQLGLSRYKVER